MRSRRRRHRQTDPPGRPRRPSGVSCALAWWRQHAACCETEKRRDFRRRKGRNGLSALPLRRGARVELDLDPNGGRGPWTVFQIPSTPGACRPSDRDSVAQIRRIAEASPVFLVRRARSLFQRGRPAVARAGPDVYAGAPRPLGHSGAGVKLLHRAEACPAPARLLTGHRWRPERCSHVESVAGKRCNCKDRTWRGGTSQEPLRNAPGGHGGLPACRTPRVLFFLLPGSHQSEMDETCGSGTRLWRPAGASNSNHTILQNEQPTIK